MHSTVKNLSAVCIILAIFHAFMGIALLIYASGYGLPFGTSFALSCYIITSMLTFLILGCSLRSLCSNLEMEYESTVNAQLALKKRIEELEFKAKM